MKRATVLFAALFVVGFFAGVVLGRGGGATAQDADGDRIAALETRVAGLYAHDETLLDRVNDLGNRALPGQDPAAYWIGNLYTYDHDRYEFGLVCRIAQMRTDYALRCTQVDHARLP